jgi:2-polyprenyl-6-methoxyphenol hydroxylase-like FAD-dependent oxidoreductase
LRTRSRITITVAGFADQPTKPATLLRGDIEKGLWHAVDGQIEVRFATSPVSITNEEAQVLVRLRHADEAETEETFGLLVGVDGLRSTVRKLVFGPHDKFMRSLDAIICERPSDFAVAIAAMMSIAARLSPPATPSARRTPMEGCRHWRRSSPL